MTEGADQVCEGVGVVKAGVAGRGNDISEVIGRQAKIGYVLEASVQVLDVHPVVLHERPKTLRYLHNYGFLHP